MPRARSSANMAVSRALVHMSRIEGGARILQSHVLDKVAAALGVTVEDITIPGQAPYIDERSIAARWLGVSVDEADELRDALAQGRA